MARIERNSPDRVDGYRHTPSGLLHHAPFELMPRHVHDHGFATVILEGRYTEAGDTGFHRVEPGDVLFHGLWESHLDRIGAGGAKVLVLPLSGDWGGMIRGVARDPDDIVRCAERDCAAAVHLLVSHTHQAPSVPADWPEHLALALREDSNLAIAEWAFMMGLHPGSISRGFEKHFAVKPAAFRANARGRLAISALLRDNQPLSSIAQQCGFADQAHMSRTISRMTGMTPKILRQTRSVYGANSGGHSLGGTRHGLSDMTNSERCQARDDGNT